MWREGCIKIKYSAILGEIPNLSGQIWYWSCMVEIYKMSQVSVCITSGSVSNVKAGQLEPAVLVEKEYDTSIK